MYAFNKYGIIVREELGTIVEAEVSAANKSTELTFQ